MPKGFDCFRPDLVVQHLASIAAAGYEAAGFYYFGRSAMKQRLTAGQAKAISRAGLSLFMVWENGFPTSADYFTAAQGEADGRQAVAQARELGQPEGSAIYAAVDYDAAESDLPAITAYFEPFHAAVKAAGYLAGPYGSGLVCQRLKDAGLSSRFWLSQSRGFAGYHDFLPHADIAQGPSMSLFGIDVDTDTTSGQGGGFRIA